MFLLGNLFFHDQKKVSLRFFMLICSEFLSFIAFTKLLIFRRFFHIIIICKEVLVFWIFNLSFDVQKTLDFELDLAHMNIALLENFWQLEIVFSWLKDTCFWIILIYFLNCVAILFLLIYLLFTDWSFLYQNFASFLIHRADELLLLCRTLYFNDYKMSDTEDFYIKILLLWESLELSLYNIYFDD